MARFQSVSETFRVASQKTLEQAHRILVATAKREHSRIMTSDPQPTTFTRMVDGKFGAVEESVKPTGIIVYRYPRMEEAVQFAMETLFDGSPVKSGEYRKSHILFVNGAPATNLKGWKPGTEITITNFLPYSRKIEVGKMRMRVSGTDMVYQRARKKIMARFGNVAKIDFTYRAYIGGHMISQSKAAAYRGHKRSATGTIEKTLKPGEHNKSDVRFPVLVISER